MFITYTTVSVYESRRLEMCVVEMHIYLLREKLNPIQIFSVRENLLYQEGDQSIPR